MLSLASVHHVAIICSDYSRSRHFYTQMLGLTVVQEVFRAERNSWKLDLAVAGQYAIELFSFPQPPPRPSRPEAQGLRHLAFAVTNLDEAVAHLQQQGISTEPIRVDEYTGRRFTFFCRPRRPAPRTL